jgi:hypothetical protein
VAPALQERLGPEATAALVDLFDVARQEWTADVTTAAVERFERRLSDEIGTVRAEIRSVDTNLRLEIAGVRQELKGDIAGLRQDMTSGFAAVRQEMAGLRQDMTGGFAAVRQEMASGFAAVRQEMGSEFAAVRQEMGILRQDSLAGRFELLKWCFAFWFGQIIAVATIVGVMLRMMQS